MLQFLIKDWRTKNCSFLRNYSQLIRRYVFVVRLLVAKALAYTRIITALENSKLGTLQIWMDVDYTFWINNHPPAYRTNWGSTYFIFCYPNNKMETLILIYVLSDSFICLFLVDQLIACAEFDHVSVTTTYSKCTLEGEARHTRTGYGLLG